MESILITVVMGPGLVALLLFLLFTYLYEQSRHQYFRAWQLGWAAYTLHYALDAWVVFREPSALVSFFSSLLLIAMALCIFVSTRLMGRQKFRLRWYDVAVGVGGMVLAGWNLRAQIAGGVFPLGTRPNPHLPLDVGLGVVLLYCSFYFYRYAHRKNSLAFTFLAISLALWAVLMVFGEVPNPSLAMFGTAGHFLGPIPQMLLGIAMVMVLFENERNAVQENALAFSTLGVDPMRLLSAEDLVPSLQSILDRLVAPLPKGRAMIYISERWRAILPSVQRGFSPELVSKMEKSGAGEYIAELAYRRGGFVTFHNFAEMSEPLPAFPGARFEQFRQVVAEEKIRNITAVSLQTREHNFGVIIFPHAERRMFGSSNLRLLIGLALQIGLTLENYMVMHDAQRRTKEYELLTQIGQAISSRLDQDEILRTVYKELGQIFDTGDFYVAFQEGEHIRFEFEVEKGQVRPKRSRKVDNGLTEYILRTGQPLLIRSDLEKARERLGTTYIPTRPSKCFCGAPIVQGGKPAGVMAIMSTDREYVFEQRDLEVLQTVAGQMSVAVENARLFAEEQRRARQFAFLNSISKTAISSEDAEQMLLEIVGHIQKNFRFDHIGIGIFDYVRKDIEIKAEAGITAKALGMRIPLGQGILGRVARTGESALVQTTGEANLQGVLSDSRAVLCIPITYGETLLGVLNVESREEDAFSPEDVLIMNTLADLLATALHNSFVFQKLQQTAITDGLTGIKTRRFFWEALSSEWKRASRSGRPFSVVLIDLDKFKEVNDTLGHLEGDLVLARVGRLLEQKCRQSNVVARYGGDEFIILMPETGVEQAQVLAERLRLWLSTDPMLQEHFITGSFGVASFPVHGFTAEEIIRVADAGMYVSKHAGGDRVSTADQSEDSESAALQRQLISGYIEGFLHREHTGPEHLEELLTTLKKLVQESQNEEGSVEILREAIEALSRAAESRELNGAGHGEAVARYADLVARALGLSAEEIDDLGYAARVHDVAQFHLRGAEVGYLEARSNRFCAIDGCPISSPRINQVVVTLREMLRDTRWPRFVRSIEIFTNEDQVQLNVLESERPVARRFFDWCAEKLPGYVPGALDYGAPGAVYRVSGGSFFQVNRFLIDQMVERALAEAEGESALELFAGVGLFSVPLARRFAKVTAVESGAGALRDLGFNAERAGVAIKAHQSSVEQFLASAIAAPDFVLADPPRAGLGKNAVRELVRLSPARITVVACDPATLARDLAGLVAGGYRLAKLTMIDLFPQTFHVEAIADLAR